MRQQPKYLEQKIQYNFIKKELLTQALTHRSYNDKNNERFEFLGDALLGAIIAQVLYIKFPNATEGELSRTRSSLVNGETLFQIASELELSKYILLGEGELRSGGLQRQSILADCLEAIVAAIYLDSDFDTCKTILLNWYKDVISNLDISAMAKDPKTILQEWLQAKQLELPEYTIVSQTGTAHDMTFVIKCQVKNLQVITDGSAKSRRKAEQIAAVKAMELILAKKL